MKSLKLSSQDLCDMLVNGINPDAETTEDFTKKLLSMAISEKSVTRALLKLRTRALCGNNDFVDILSIIHQYETLFEQNKGLLCDGIYNEIKEILSMLCDGIDDLMADAVFSVVNFAKNVHNLKPETKKGAGIPRAFL